MNYRKLYLIHEEDYLAHINDKVDLLIMLQQLVNHVKKSSIATKDKELDKFTDRIDTISFEMFRDFGIPVEFLLSRDPEDIADLMDSELLLPDDAEEEEKEDEDEIDKDENCAEHELEELLAHVLHCLTGEDVEVHIICK